ncbi:hypothetical protein BDF19DRAFT_413563 [Syncephalis fuscata]|nr:hypothetical protein BDF19DRAFT_413563 [Syncephalis fuscata]
MVDWCILLLFCSISAILGRYSVECSQHCAYSSTSSAPLPSSSVYTPQQAQFWSFTAIVVGLMFISGLSSGLQPALLALDNTNLHIIRNIGTPIQQEWASKILPIRKDTTLLMVTLVLTNTLANEALPMVMNTVVDGSFIPVLLSSIGVFIFGELVPQGLCSHYGLMVSAWLTWPVKFLMIIFWIIVKPIALLLDLIFGKTRGMVYHRPELKELVTYYGDPEHGDLSSEEVKIIRGTLDLQLKTAGDIMTPLSQVFSIDIDAVLDEELLELIAKEGYSRIPVYQNEKNSVIGVLLTKNLIGIHSDDGIPVGEVCTRPCLTVASDTSLLILLLTFEKGTSHMAMVKGSDSDVIIGIVTLEDVIEEMLQQQIFDESDLTVYRLAQQQINRAIKKFALLNRANLQQNQQRQRRWSEYNCSQSTSNKSTGKHARNASVDQTANPSMYRTASTSRHQFSPGQDKAIHIIVEEPQPPNEHSSLLPQSSTNHS